MSHQQFTLLPNTDLAASASQCGCGPACRCGPDCACNAQSRCTPTCACDR